MGNKCDPADAVLPTPPEYQMDNLHDAVRASSDVIKGWRFCATLQLRTPLAVLEHHGDEILDVDAMLPEHGQSWMGMWVPIVKSWKELGIALRELPDETMASEIGYVAADGGDFLPFLKQYRGIIEGATPVADRVAALRNLLAQPRHVEIAGRLGPRPAERWAIEALRQACAIGPTIAERLFAAGFVDAEAVRRATDGDLSSVRGVGPTTRARIRAALAAGSTGEIDGGPSVTQR